MVIQRNFYLQQLIAGKKNGLIKIVTGIRRCGKSFLLFNLFYKHLISSGVDENHIIRIALDNIENEPLRDALALYREIKSRMVDDELYFILLDEVQIVPKFEEVLNSLLRIENADVYVTGSNSKFLSSDIVTEFRGRGDEIRVYPFSLQECCQALKRHPRDVWRDYYVYGGLPQVFLLDSPKKKADYLTNLVESVYLVDILERHNIKNESEFRELASIVASCVGSPTNPTKISNSFKSQKNVVIKSSTIEKYLDYMSDAFLIEKAVRYNIKGRKYIGSLSKYYFIDTGIRNAVIGMRQLDESHLMENVIYNELCRRGCRVDVGVVEQRSVSKEGKWSRQPLEVDFVANDGGNRWYIQSALHIVDDEKRQQETASLLRIDDAFQKIIIVGDDIAPWRDDNGILTVGLFDFLMDFEKLHRI